MKYELIVFDWDGTLLDSAGAIVKAIQSACRDLDLPVPADSQARHVIGLGLVDAMRHAVPDLPPDRYQAMVDRYRFHYLAGDHQLTLFEGVPQMLERLQGAGHILAIATGKVGSGWTGHWITLVCVRFSRPRAAPMNAIRSRTRKCWKN